MPSMIERFDQEDSISTPKYKVYRIRFYVLFTFCFLAFNQCLIWSTFSPIYDSTEMYYNISESTVDLFLAWGPICFIPCLPLTYFLLNKPNGLRYCVILLSIMELISTIIRIIPSLSVHFRSISLPFIHIGQIVNAICGPLAMVPVSQLSCLWFDTNERTRATTIAIMAYNLGSTLSFPLGPSVVSSPEDIPHLLYIHLGFAIIGFILVIIYFPGQPPTPPSPAAELLIKHPVNEGSVRSLVHNIRRCFSTPSFILLVTASGLIGGTFGVWTSLFDVILTPLNYTDKQIGKEKKIIF
jgi:FLVCR family MFS transporter